MESHLIPKMFDGRISTFYCIYLMVATRSSDKVFELRWVDRWLECSSE